MTNKVYVEVCLKERPRDSKTSQKKPAIREKCLEYLKNAQNLPFGVPFHVDSFTDVESILLEHGGAANPSEATPTVPNYRLYCYYLRNATEESGLQCQDEQQQYSSVAYTDWVLPSRSFHGLWESLVYDEDVKKNLLSYAFTAISFSDRKVNNNIIACNRLLLLHGPPGTGKTSLCRALAQKIAIRVTGNYDAVHLIEINSHSLFSKWYAESGNLVMRLFRQLREIAQDTRVLCCVLIDEVESLAFARGTMPSNEPQDSMRVVNALLTQLDSLRQYPNVLTLATSNLASTIDVAFLDRADIKQYIGPPSKSAIRSIYTSIFEELRRVGILAEERGNDQLDDAATMAQLSMSLEITDHIEDLCERSTGLSGRTLRKLPFLAQAALTDGGLFDNGDQIQLKDFVKAIGEELERHNKNHRTIKIHNLNS